MQAWGTGRERGGWQDLMGNGARRRQQEEDEEDCGLAHACLAINFISTHVTATAWSASLLIDGARGIGGACRRHEDVSRIGKWYHFNTE